MLARAAPAVATSPQAVWTRARLFLTCAPFVAPTRAASRSPLSSTRPSPSFRTSLSPPRTVLAWRHLRGPLRAWIQNSLCTRPLLLLPPVEATATRTGIKARHDGGKLRQPRTRTRLIMEVRILPLEQLCCTNWQSSVRLWLSHLVYRAEDNLDEGVLEEQWLPSCLSEREYVLPTDHLSLWDSRGDCAGHFVVARMD